MIFAFELTCALTNDNVKRNHDELLSDLASSIVGEAIHSRVDRHVGKCMAKICVSAVCWARPHNLSWVEILDRQLCVVLALRILCKIALHEKSEVD